MDAILVDYFQCDPKLKMETLNEERTHKACGMFSSGVSFSAKEKQNSCNKLG